MKINIEFSGGLELLFSNEKKLQVELDEGSDMKVLLEAMVQKMSDPRTDLFLQDNLVRPGILVLVNDADWELVGEEEYVLQNNDTVHFASTLHGG